MRTKDIRKQLHEVIEKIADRETLKAAHHLLSQKLDEEVIQEDHILSAEQKKELDRRWREHRNGSSKSYDWPTAKKMIRNYSK